MRASDVSAKTKQPQVTLEMEPDYAFQALRFIVVAWICLGLSGCGAVDSAGVAPTANAKMDGSVQMPPAELAFNTEAYDAIEENEFVEALQVPQSTFAVDVDTASYSNVRRYLKQGSLPPAGAVRIEELVNYFGYQYPEPTGQHPFSVTTELGECPWSPGNQLLRIGLKGKSVDFQDRQPCNLVFLLDVSGSMQAANKLPLVQSALQLMLGELQPQDRIAIVAYAGASGLVLDSTPVARATEILGALQSLRAGGGTNGASGIHLAYQAAEENFVESGVNRVILCTDGDFNVGTTSQSELVELIEAKARTGIEISVMGFGTGNLKDSTMEKLADRGNGNYAYIDSLLEARKVLVQQLGGTLTTIAKDVKIQIDFNPLHVQAYRLLGYENRVLANQDFRDDAKDAGEIGAGHDVTAFYQIVPSTIDQADGSEATSDGARNSEFVAQQLVPQADATTMLTVNLRYKLPGSAEGREFQVRVDEQAWSNESTADQNFAAAVVAYGMLLRGSQHAGLANWKWVVDSASNNLGDDPLGVRAEFVQLARLAGGLSK